MSDEEETDEEENRQLKKIKFLGLNTSKFKATRRKLLEEDPDLLTGIPRDMRYDPDRQPETRSKWEETFKRWRRGDKKKR